MIGVIICLYTGLRIGELLALEWKDIDFTKGIISISKSCHYGHDENGDYKRFTDTPKTSHSIRNIPLPKQLIPLLKQLKKSNNTQIGENIKSIGSYAFYGCSSLDNQTFPTTLTSIGSGAFMNCTAFTEINIPQNVTSIGDSAFSGCSSVTAITLEEGVETIGSGAFCNINKVTKITIPTTVTSMGSGLFSGMSALEELTIPFVGRDQYISQNGGDNSESNKHYPLGYMFGNSSYTGSVAVDQYYTYDYLTSSGIYYEQDGSSSTYYIPATLKTVTVTNAKYIFYGAFSYLYSNSSTGSTKTSPLNITTINLNEGIKRIGSYAFASYNHYSEA